MPPGGRFHSCGLRTDGTITCWGSDIEGQLNAPAGQFSAVSAGGFHSCGLRTDGTITCWGNNDGGQADPSAVGLGEPPAPAPEIGPATPR